MDKTPRVGENNITDTQSTTSPKANANITTENPIRIHNNRFNSEGGIDPGLGKKGNKTVSGKIPEETTTQLSEETTTMEPITTPYHTTFDVITMVDATSPDRETTTDPNINGNTENTKRPTTRVDTSLETIGGPATVKPDVTSPTTILTTTIPDATEPLITVTDIPVLLTNITTTKNSTSKDLIFCHTSIDCAPFELCMDKRCLAKCDPSSNETNINCAKGT